MESKPYFSIIIPTYNRAKFIGDTIESILKQTINDFEVLIIDDGSTDDTDEVIKQISDSRIKYHWKVNQERGAARNFGISKSTGKYVTFLDSDDRFLESSLEKARNFIELNDYPEWLHFAYRVVNSNGDVLSRSSIPIYPNRSLLTGNWMSCLGIFVRKDIIDEIRFVEDRDLAGSEDWVLWMKLASRFPLLISKEITAELVNHNERSVVNIVPEKLVKRINKAGNLVTGDEAFRQMFSKSETKVWAHLHLYTALHLAVAKQKKMATQYLVKSLKDPSVLLTKKPYVILKKLISN